MRLVLVGRGRNTRSAMGEELRGRRLPFLTCRRGEEFLQPALRSTAFGGGLSCAGPYDPLHVSMFLGEKQRSSIRVG